MLCHPDNCYIVLKLLLKILYLIQPKSKIARKSNPIAIKKDGPVVKDGSFVYHLPQLSENFKKGCKQHSSFLCVLAKHQEILPSFF